MQSQRNEIWKLILLIKMIEQLFVMLNVVKLILFKFTYLEPKVGVYSFSIAILFYWGYNCIQFIK